MVDLSSPLDKLFGDVVVMDTVPRAVDCPNSNGRCSGHQNTRTIRNDILGKVRNHQTFFGGSLAHHRIITAQFHRIIWVITTAYQSAKSVRIFLVLRRKKISKKQRRKKNKKTKQIQTKIEIPLKNNNTIQSCKTMKWKNSNY